ncbi:hypothetical protein BBW65_04780 [Helicobacter enhydrae]|uniref:Uncharacterized protein n=1 Tax=Helicobacter enhydrae TaxID=222136 RepID=A0A1B1U5X4_9HELI|nr:glycosyltransferase family 10 [Helicobacter enhydrae]ANV98156.1 hypothetical protein BBW65_04780 [Helicobacter enhydrae]
MQEIKLNVVDWWEEKLEYNYFLSFLSKKYKIIQSDKPDFLLCSVFGNQHLEYDCIKIFYTGEAITPDFNFYDYALGFDYLDFGDRYLRYPLFLLDQKTFKLAEQKHLLKDEAKLLQRDFCSFVVSNGNAHPIRKEFFEALSKINFVASGGRYQNNIGKYVENKLDFIQSYKFNIAFENSRYAGYCTEKIIDAFAAQSIPIYWGDPSLKTTFKNNGGGEIAS